MKKIMSVIALTALTTTAFAGKGSLVDHFISDFNVTKKAEKLLLKEAMGKKDFLSDAGLYANIQVVQRRAAKKIYSEFNSEYIILNKFDDGSSFAVEVAAIAPKKQVYANQVNTKLQITMADMDTNISGQVLDVIKKNKWLNESIEKSGAVKPFKLSNVDGELKVEILLKDGSNEVTLKEASRIVNDAFSTLLKARDKKVKDGLYFSRTLKKIEKGSK